MDGTQASEVVDAVETVDEGASPAVVEPASAAEGAGPEADGAGQAGALRELVLKANPEVVPEMVAGETLEDLLASVPGAQAAYERLAESLNRPATIPAGGTTRDIPRDISAMPAVVKIREGLKG